MSSLAHLVAFDRQKADVKHKIVASSFVAGYVSFPSVHSLKVSFVLPLIFTQSHFELNTFLFFLFHIKCEAFLVKNKIQFYINFTVITSTVSGALQRNFSWSQLFLPSRMQP